MRKNTFTKLLSIVIAVGMLISFVPTSVFAESTVLQEVPIQSVTPNAEVKLSGVITDGGIDADIRHGYPLYAKITLTSAGGETILYSDPFTGKYEAMVEADVEYTIKVEAQLSGYQVFTETFTPTAALTKNIEMMILGACTAPGYAPDFPFYYTFEGGDHGFVAGGTNPSWAWGDITSGPNAARSGTKGIATNPAGDYNTSELSWMESPAIDLSADSSRTPVIQYWDWLYTEHASYTWDVASFQVSKDGGATWDTKWGPSPRQDAGSEYTKQLIVLDPSYAVANFKFRFHFKSDFSGNRAGWYIDDIGVAAIPLPPPTLAQAFKFDTEDEPVWTADSIIGTNQWQQGAPTSGPNAPYSSPNVWATNLAGEYTQSTTSYITSPAIDLHEHAGKSVLVRWYDWMQVENANYDWDYGSIWVSGDGTTFTQIGENHKRVDTGSTNYTMNELIIPEQYTTDTFHLRFQFRADSSGNRLGWYIDDVDILISEPLGNIEIPCGKVPGGIVAGFVYDLNEEDSDVVIHDAKVATPLAFGMTTPAPHETAPDGLYYFFQEMEAAEENIEFTVTKDKFGTVVEERTITADAVNKEIFRIGSGWIVPLQTSFERSIYLHDDDEYDTLTLHNRGAAYGNWSLRESDMGFVPLSIPAFEGELAPQPAESLTTLVDRSPRTNQATAELGAFHSKPINLFGGSMAYANEVRSNDTLYRVPDLEIPGTWEQVAPMAVTYYAGDFLRSDFSKIYAVSDTDNFVTIDTETGAVTPIGPLTLPSGLSSVQGISGGPGFFYGSSSNCSSYTAIFTITPEGTTELVANTPIACGIDLAYAPDKNMIFVVDIVSDHLYSYDLATNETKDVGSLGFGAGYAQGMDYDEANKILYWAAYGSGGNGQLRVIDTETGNSALVGPFPGDNEVAFLAIAAGGAGGGGEVPWLDEDPIEGLIEAGEYQDIQLHFTVKDIEQPGDYFAELHFTTDTPKEIAPIPVTLHVWRPFNYGNFKGTVTATQKCDVDPAPLAEATINFYLDGEKTKSTETDENGYYNYSVIKGTYDIEVVKEGYVTTKVEGVVLGNSEDIVVDLSVRHDSPCLVVEPELLYAQVYPDQKAEKKLLFRNTGSQDAVFEISEVPGEGPVPYALADVELVLDDGSYDDAIGIGGNSQFLVVNRFTPEADLFPFTINEVQIYFETTVQAGDPFEIYLYQNETSQDNPAPGSEFLYKQAATVPAQNSWAVITLEEPVTFEGPGDVLIGAGFLKKPGASYFPASIDTTATQSRSWAGWYTGDIPSTPTLPPDDTWTKIDAAGIAGNWMIRGYGESGGGTPGDIPWLELDTTAGVAVADGGEVEITAKFDGTGLTWGDYFGQLRVDNAPDPRFNIPVQLRILPFNMMHLPLIITYFPPPLN